MRSGKIDVLNCESRRIRMAFAFGCGYIKVLIHAVNSEVQRGKPRNAPAVLMIEANRP